jgi:pimeloyl-ACP methyl ester carboxylesterase
MSNEISFRYVASGDVSLHVASAGAGEAIMFLHGFPEFWRCWAPYMAALWTRALCLAPDLRGFNLSEKPQERAAYRLDRIVADSLAIADAFDLARFTLVGHDWGGAAAWRFAERFPQRLRRLVVINGPHTELYDALLRSDPAQRSAAQYARRLAAPDSALLLAPAGPTDLWRRLYADHEASGELSEVDRAAYLEAWSREGAIDAMLNLYRSGEVCVPAPDEAFCAFDFRCAHKVQTPTLVIWGEQDSVLSPRFPALFACVAEEPRVVRFGDAGHGVVHEKRAEIIALLNSLLAET